MVETVLGCLHKIFLLEPIDSFCDHCLSLVVRILLEAVTGWLQRLFEADVLLRAHLIMLVHIDALKAFEAWIPRAHPVWLDPGHPRGSGQSWRDLGVAIHLLERARLRGPNLVLLSQAQSLVEVLQVLIREIAHRSVIAERVVEVLVDP